MESALSPLYDAAYALLRDGDEPSAALQALGVAYVGAEPYGQGLPYVRFDSDTEAPDAFFSDASGTASDATLTLTIWAQNDHTARAIADHIIPTLTGSLTVDGFGVIRAALDLNSRVPGQPGEAQGRALRFRFTTQPQTA